MASAEDLLKTIKRLAPKPQGALRAHTPNLWSTRAQDSVDQIAADIGDFPVLQRMQGRYQQILQKHFPGMSFSSEVIGGSFRFTGMKGGSIATSFSLPTGSYVFDKITGKQTGFRGSVRLAHTTGALAGTVEDYTTALDRMLAGRNVGQIHDVIGGLNRLVRYDPGETRALNPGAGLHAYTAIATDPLYGQQVSRYRQGDLTQAGLVSSLRAINQGTLAQLPGWYLDPTHAEAASQGRLTRFRPSDLSPFGGLGYSRAAQPFRTIPISTDPGMAAWGHLMQNPARYGFSVAGGQARNIAMHGSFLRTSFMEVLSQGQVQGINTTMDVVFGQAAGQHLVYNPDNIMLARGTASLLARTSVAPGGRRLGVGVGTALFGDTFAKSNVSGIYRIGTHGFTAGAVRTMGKANPMMTMKMLFGTHLLAAAEAGATTQDIVSGIRRAIGARHLTSDLGQAVLKTFDPASDRFLDTGRLFDLVGRAGRLSPEKQALVQGRRMRRFLRKLGRELGTGGIADLERRGYVSFGEGGLLESVRTIQNLAMREGNLFPYGRSHQLGLTLNAPGLKITEALIADVEAHGAPTMGRYLRGVRAQPAFREAQTFAASASGVLKHLVSGEARWNPAESIPVTSVSQMTRGKFFDRMLHSVDLMKAETGGLDHVKRVIAAWGGIPGLNDTQMGMMVDLGRDRMVSLGAGGAGNIRHLPLFNLGNMTDQYAYDVLSLIQSGGDIDDKTLARLASAGFDMVSGGKGSVLSQLTNPRLGQTQWYTIQNPDNLMGTGSRIRKNSIFSQPLVGGTAQNMGPMDRYWALVEQHQRRFGLPVERTGNWAFVSSRDFKGLSKAEKATYRRLGYLPTLSHRDPGVGKSALPTRMVFADWLRGDAVVERPGASAFGGGDTDWDRKIFQKISLAGPDALSQDAMTGFKEMEQFVEKDLARHDLEVANRNARGGLTSQLYNSAEVKLGRLSEAEVRVLLSQAASGELTDVKRLMDKAGITARELKAYTKAIGTTTVLEYENKQMAQNMAKLATPKLDPHIGQRRAMANAMARAGELNMTSGQRAVYAEVLASLTETAVTKHGGTDSMSIIEAINRHTHARGKADSAVVNAEIENLFKAGFETYHKQKSSGTLATYGAEIFGAEAWAGAGGTLPDDIGPLMQSKNFKDFVKSMADVEARLGRMSQSHPEFWRERVNRAVYDERTAAAARSGVIQGLPENLDPVEREFVRNIRPELELRGDLPSPPRMKADSVAQASRISTATSKGTGAKVADTIGDSISGLADNLGGWIVKTAKKNKVAAGLTMLGAGAFASILALKVGANAVKSGYEHIAGQQDQQIRAPNTQYVMKPTDEMGMSLSMKASLPPEDISMGNELANALMGRTDIRVMDSRVRLSDRVVGHLAEDRLKSIYASSPI